MIPATNCILQGEILEVKDGAILFNFGGVNGKEVWLGKNNMRSWSTEELGATCTVEIPAWLMELYHLQQYSQI